MTPELTFGTGTSTASVWVRTDDPALGDGLQFRLSTAGASVDVGTTTTSVGAFTAGVGVPLTDGWAQFTVTITNPGAPVSGRLALRYVVTDTSVNGDYIGIDDFSFQSTEPVPEPGTLLLMRAGGLALFRRRHHN